MLATKSLIRLGITAVSNETITVTAGGASWTSGNKYFPYGTTWTATVAGATGYNAGSLTPGSSGTLTNANVTVTAGAASLKTYTLKLNATTHQTITLKYKNRNAANTGFEAEVTKTSTSSAQSFTVRRVNPRVFRYRDSGYNGICRFCHIQDVYAETECHFPSDHNAEVQKQKVRRHVCFGGYEDVYLFGTEFYCRIRHDLDSKPGGCDGIYKGYIVRLQRNGDGSHDCQRNGGYGYHTEDYVHMDG